MEMTLWLSSIQLTSHGGDANDDDDADDVLTISARRAGHRSASASGFLISLCRVHPTPYLTHIIIMIKVITNVVSTPHSPCRLTHSILNTHSFCTSHTSHILWELLARQIIFSAQIELSTFQKLNLTSCVNPRVRELSLWSLSMLSPKAVLRAG